MKDKIEINMKTNMKSKMKSKAKAKIKGKKVSKAEIEAKMASKAEIKAKMVSETEVKIKKAIPPKVKNKMKERILLKGRTTVKAITILLIVIIFFADEREVYATNCSDKASSNFVKNIKISGAAMDFTKNVKVSGTTKDFVKNINISGATMDFAKNLKTSDAISDFEEYFDFSEINDFINSTNEKNGTGERLDFEDIVKDFASGDMNSGTDKFLKIIKKNLFLELSVNRSSIRRILALAFVTAIFSNFVGIFKNSQVSDMGFLICYTAIMTYLIGSFTALSYIAFEVIGTITDFMKALIPVYAVSVGISDGQGNAASFYQMALVIIALVDFVSIKLILPAIDIYVGLGMINHLGDKDYLSKSCELIKNVVGFATKGMITVVTGLNIIQKMFSPLSGIAGGNIAKNMVNTISGVTPGGTSIAELLYGTGKIIRSSIGGAGVVVLCVILIVPLIKILVFIFTYQITNAVIQPVSDKRITNCLSCVCDGAVMLLRTVFACMVMFVITITIICVG